MKEIYIYYLILKLSIIYAFILHMGKITCGEIFTLFMDSAYLQVAEPFKALIKMFVSPFPTYPL
jgi:hypothetical protein